MSLKAKIEAVIYASEEPVTLAQLAGLLGLEAQTELDRLDERQQMLALGVEEQAVEAAVLEEVEAQLEAEAAPATEPEAEPAPEAALEAEASPEVAAAPQAEPEVAAEPEAAKELTREQEKNRERRLREYFRQIVDELIADYATSDRGLEIREVAGGLRMATKPEYHDAVRGFVKSLKPALKLSLQALETLAVVAYKQPVTAPEVSEIRGVDSSGVLGSLMGRKLIATAGRKQVIGRPMLYRTTKDFLLRFGLKDIQELPSIEEFEKMAGELADIEPVQKEIPMSEAETKEEALRTAAELEEERYASAPQADGDSKPVDEEEAADTEIVDGRISGLPPRYEEEDGSERDAEIQADEQREAEAEEESL